MKDIRFCSDLTRESGEPMAGTAPFGDRFVFITWPKRLWNYEVLDSGGGFPPGLKQWMKHRSSKGNRITIRFASRPGIRSDSVQLFFYPEARTRSDVSPKDLPHVLEHYYAHGNNPGLHDTQLDCDQVFVCTHGRHDQCCAKYGQAVYQRMRDEVSTLKLTLKIWESSHLGGHRFAANLIVFPQGHAHGHLLPDQVSEFLRNWRHGQVHGPTYRGLVYIEGLEQTAEACMMHYCYQKGWNCAVRILNMQEGTDSEFHCVVELNPVKRGNRLERNAHPVPFRRLQAWFRAVKFENPGGCDALDEPKKRTTWVIDRITRLE